MKYNNVIIFILIFTLLSCAGAPQVKIQVERNYLEDSKTYFNYREYEKAIENALIAYKNSDNKAKKEEALYILNELAEEIVLEIKSDLYVKSYKDIEKRLEHFKNNYGLYIKCKKIGYEYIVYYEKDFYHKLLRLNPESAFAKKIELRHMARMSKFVSDPAYRYKQIINVTEKYKKVFKGNPESIYAPSLLLKIADLYFYLYEQGIYVKKELNLTQSDLDNYFKEARNLYREIKKKYPNSIAAKTIAYVIDNVKLRKEPKTKTKVLMRVKAGTLVKIIDRSEKKASISNMYAYWYKVKLISGLEGWIFGFYLRMNY